MFVKFVHLHASLFRRLAALHAHLLPRLAALHAHLLPRLAHLHAHVFIPYWCHPCPFRELSAYSTRSLSLSLSLSLSFSLSLSLYLSFFWGSIRASRTATVGKGHGKKNNIQSSWFWTASRTTTVGKGHGEKIEYSTKKHIFNHDGSELPVPFLCLSWATFGHTGFTHSSWFWTAWIPSR